MSKIAQETRWRLSLVKYASRYGATEAGYKYHVSRSTVYRWMKRYDGSEESLKPKSRRPKHHPNEHTKAELELIANEIATNRFDGLVVRWVNLMRKGYTRSISALYRIMKRFGFYYRKKRKTNWYKPKPYKQMTYPGERVQIDVKQVPRGCMSGVLPDELFYQYTAVDEYTRMRYLEIFRGKDTYTSVQFLKHAIGYFQFKIVSVRTDNGQEFTNRLHGKNSKLSIFEQELATRGISFSPIRPYTPRHNGKVERSHRTDNERFYSRQIFNGFRDLRRKAMDYLLYSNNFPMYPLKWLSPIQFFKACCSVTSVSHV